jgi:hypothetical protein
MLLGKKEEKDVLGMWIRTLKKTLQHLLCWSAQVFRGCSSGSS